MSVQTKLVQLKLQSNQCICQTVRYYTAEQVFSPDEQQIVQSSAEARSNQQPFASRNGGQGYHGDKGKGLRCAQRNAGEIRRDQITQHKGAPEQLFQNRQKHHETQDGQYARCHCQ